MQDMIFGFIAVGIVVQLLFYWLATLGELPTVKQRAVCATLVLLHLTVFPHYFMPEPDPEQVCGMPVLGTYLAFWVFGIAATFITHLITEIFRYAQAHEPAE